MSAEDDEFREVERQHALERERLGQAEWERQYYTRTIHLWAAFRGGRRARQEIEIRVRDLSTLPSEAPGHGHGPATGDMAYSGTGDMAYSGTGDMAYSGTHTWGSAVALAQYLLAQPHLVEGKSVLELGAGTGLPSLAACRFAASVVATDRSEELLSNVLHNAGLNSEDVLVGGASRLETQVLCWESEAPIAAKYDLVVGAEVMHEEGTMKRLARVVCSALKGGGGVFLGVSPAGARRGAIDAFKASCTDWSAAAGEVLSVEEQPFPIEMMLEEYEDEWNVGSVQDDALCLITVTKL